jgi:hypothetical protein
MEIHKTQEKCANFIIIKSSDYIFEKGSYSQDILDGYISKGDFKDILNDINDIISKVLSNKEYNLNEKTSKCNIYNILMMACFLLTITYVILIYYSTDEKIEILTREFLHTISIILMSLVMVIILGISIETTFLKLGKMTKLNDKLKSEINKYLVHINIYFEGRLNFKYIHYDYSLRINLLKKEIRNSSIDKKKEIIAMHTNTLKVLDKKESDKNNNKLQVYPNEEVKINEFITPINYTITFDK